HVAWHWMVERLDALRFVRWPSVDAAALGWILAGLVLLALIGGALWLSRNEASSRSRERVSRRPDEVRGSAWPAE
ncbi:MAG: hypothetical protein ACREIR_19305, partial [Geminicoccaceae bacterium]